MATMVMIGGAPVDASDPCALWQALYAVKLKRLANETVEETEIQSPVSKRRLRVAVASIAELDAELKVLAAECQKKNGGGRSRFAKRVRFT